jgi:hypothetical protein
MAKFHNPHNGNTPVLSFKSSFPDFYDISLSPEEQSGVDIRKITRGLLKIKICIAWKGSHCKKTSEM